MVKEKIKEMPGVEQLFRNGRGRDSMAPLRRGAEERADSPPCVWGGWGVPEHKLLNQSNSKTCRLLYKVGSKKLADCSLNWAIKLKSSVLHLPYKRRGNSKKNVSKK